MTFGASYPNIKKERGCKGVGSTANDLAAGNMTFWAIYLTFTAPRPTVFSKSALFLLSMGSPSLALWEKQEPQAKIYIPAHRLSDSTRVGVWQTNPFVVFPIFLPITLWLCC